MTRVRPRQIEAALLYHRAPDLNLAELGEALSAELPDLEVCANSANQTEMTGIALQASKETIIIRPVPYALPAEMFTGALNTPLSRMTHAERLALVQSHRAHLRIEVKPRDTGDADTQASFEKRLRTCREVTMALIDQARPSGVLWCQSQQIFGAAHFAHLAHLFPLALYLHPRLVKAYDAETGRDLLGLEVQGASSFLGKPLVFEPSTLSLEEMNELALSFISARREGDLKTGEVFGMHSGNRVQVTESAAAPGQPDTVIRLIHDPETLPASAPAPAPVKERTKRPPRVEAPEIPAPAALPATPEERLRDVFRDPPPPSSPIKRMFSSLSTGA